MLRLLFRANGFDLYHHCWMRDGDQLDGNELLQN